MNTKPQSKSKTFPKGTDISEIADFITDQVHTRIIDGKQFAYDAIKEKVLITIVTIPEKEVKEDKI